MPGEYESQLAKSFRLERYLYISIGIIGILLWYEDLALAELYRSNIMKLYSYSITSIQDGGGTGVLHRHRQHHEPVGNLSQHRQTVDRHDFCMEQFSLLSLESN